MLLLHQASSNIADKERISDKELAVVVIIAICFTMVDILRRYTVYRHFIDTSTNDKVLLYGQWFQRAPAVTKVDCDLIEFSFCYLVLHLESYL